MNPLMSVKVNLPWWIPPMEYWGYKLDKPYWMFVYTFPKGFIQTTHGLN